MPSSLRGRWSPQANAGSSRCFPSRSGFAEGALGTQRCGLAPGGVKIKPGFEAQEGWEASPAASPSPQALPASRGALRPRAPGRGARRQGRHPWAHGDAPLPAQSSRCRKILKMDVSIPQTIARNIFVVCKGQCDNYYSFKKKRKKKKEMTLKYI